MEGSVMKNIKIYNTRSYYKYIVYIMTLTGTLPTTSSASAEVKANFDQESHLNVASELIKVEPGYTVLSIVEELHIGPVKAACDYHRF
ncbi:hypothetical protein KHA80_03480 [Anaerobacillus sp. HL2]|nr:hypothetical protein KHA80_03480 [Anaerobacillus sp. HL2]